MQFEMNCTAFKSQLWVQHYN